MLSHCFFTIMTSKLWHTFFTLTKPLIKVCAWCPKDTYPALKPGEEYTHGMCHKHYRQLSIKKDLALSLLIAELFEKTRDQLGKKRRTSLKRLHTSVKLQLQKLNNLS